MVRSTITLAMMAHNEARYLPIVEQNLRDRINSVLIISDPPNDDDTIEVAKQVFLPYNTQIIERPWPTDSHAASIVRNEILNKAKEMGDDYVLWLDPDSPLIGTIPEELDAPVYAFMTLDIASNISWVQPHLIRCDQNFTWKGRVHEYLDTGQTPVSVLNTARIERNGSGGGIPTMRDVHLPLLLMDIEEEPKNPRHWNYLAQTYRDIGEYDKAIETYKHRSEMFGFDQETFYAYYMIGICYLLKGGPHADIFAEPWFLKAYAFRPSRIEPIQRLKEIYQRSGNYVLAMQLMENAAATPPTQDILLVSNRQMLPQNNGMQNNGIPA